MVAATPTTAAECLRDALEASRRGDLAERDRLCRAGIELIRRRRTLFVETMALAARNDNTGSLA